MTPINFEEKCGVDTGMLIVADIGYLRSQPCKSYPDDEAFVEVPKGLYSCTWAIPDTWNGSIKGNHHINVPSGTVVVCDPGYVIGARHEDWLAWLKRTDYGKKLPKTAFIIDSMGGDGYYTVRLRLKALGKV